MSAKPASLYLLVGGLLVVGCRSREYGSDPGWDATRVERHQTLTQQGDAAAEQGDWDAAGKAYVDAADIQPHDAGTLWRVAVATSKQKNKAACARALLMLSQLHPEVANDEEFQQLVSWVESAR